ncbi:MAG: hypothetical protein DRN90_05455 [Thermoproteota archaeon]|nr:MAG: hypothetical protein DRN90_05455 [Candidatus Korarchaeota archaeon]
MLIVALESHLDPVFSWMSPSSQEERRRDFQENFKRAVEYALEKEADLFLLPGDVFDRVRPRLLILVKFAEELRALNKAGVRVYAVPGHHDRPKTRRMPTPLHVYSRAGLLRLFDRIDVIEVDKFEIDGISVALGGIGFNPFIIEEGIDPLRNIRTLGEFDADLNILMIHDVIEGFAPPGRERHVIRRTSIPKEVDLVVAGHLHAHTVQWGNPTICYVGTIERLSFSEENEKKGFTIIEADRNGVKRVEQVDLPTKPMVTIEYGISGNENLTGTIISLLEKTSSEVPREAIVRLKLRGAMLPEIRTTYAKDQILARARELFFDLKLEEEFEYPDAFSAPKISLASPIRMLDKIYEEAISKEESEDRRKLIDDAYRLAVDALREAGGW